MRKSNCKLDSSTISTNYIEDNHNITKIIRTQTKSYNYSSNAIPNKYKLPIQSQNHGYTRIPYHLNQEDENPKQTMKKKMRERPPRWWIELKLPSSTLQEKSSSYSYGEEAWTKLSSIHGNSGNGGELERSRKVEKKMTKT